MNKSNKIIILLSVLIACCLCFFLAQSQNPHPSISKTESNYDNTLLVENDNKDDIPKENDEPLTQNIEEEIAINDLIINFSSNYESAVVYNEISKYYGATVIRLPITWQNNTSKATTFPLFSISVYDPAGIETNTSIGALFNDSTVKAPSILPGTTQSSFFYFLYTQDGDYTIILDTHEIGKNDITIKLPVNLNMSAN